MCFSKEQIMESNNYKEVCEKFLSLTKDEVILKKLKELLYDGKTDSYVLKSKFHCKDNPSIERTRRVAMASVLIRNPETFDFFQNNNINIFHGSNANALPGILKYGINSQKALEEKSVQVLTGEGRFKRSFISFTDVLDIAEDYSSLSSANGNEDLKFSVVFGISESEMGKVKTTRISSDISEIGVLNSFPLDSISCICVPMDKVKIAKKMVNNYHIKVLGMCDLNEKSFYVDDWNVIHLFEGVYENKFKNYRKFSINGVKKLTESRTIFQMKKFIEKIQNIITKTEEDEIGRNFK